MTKDNLPKMLVLIDGDCRLCHGLVQFIIKRDPAERFVFASLQSEVGQQQLEKFQLGDRAFDSFILIKREHIFAKSTAGIQVLQHLKGAWKLASLFSIIPKPLRDLVYTWVATNRYRWFGHRDQCMLMSPKLRKRFLDGNA